MTSIEERAKEYANDYIIDNTAIVTDSSRIMGSITALLHKVASENYKKGAIGQKKFYIEKACRLWRKNILKAQITEKEFRKAMEK